MGIKKTVAVRAVTDENIISRIYLVRNQKVMVDSDLADMYAVEARVLNQAVKRNSNRFPADFMFQLTDKEFENLKSQIVTSRWGGKRKRPYVFTEQGVSMLSGVLNSPVAIQVHIQIIRVFARMKELVLSHKDLLLKLEKLEKEVGEHQADIALIFEALKKLLDPKPPKRRMIGFLRREED